VGLRLRAGASLALGDAVATAADATDLRRVFDQLLVLARGLLAKVFEPADVRWRALGTIPKSGLVLRPEYGEYDALKRFQPAIPDDKEPAGCLCGRVITGAVTPHDCKLFGKTCTPINPIGPCMVSSEGSCAAHYAYGRFRDRAKLRRAS